MGKVKPEPNREAKAATFSRGSKTRSLEELQRGRKLGGKKLWD